MIEQTMFTFLGTFVGFLCSFLMLLSINNKRVVKVPREWKRDARKQRR